MTKKKFYVTTAIDYVNAAPHIGHAFEKVLADAISRWKKIQEKEVWFLTGTDENAQKNSQVAKEQGVDVQIFVDKNSELFRKLCDNLDVVYDRFIKTTEEEHRKKAREIFQKVYDKGDIYKGKYEGLYCRGCEAFLTEKDLVGGKCPEHNTKPELISEDSYFFKMSKYEKQVLKFVKDYVVPASKRNEIVSRIKEDGLRDLCVARSNLDWGIDCPIDDKFKIYVWFDALINYLSGADGNWPADVHVVGKGINWFHSVIWPSMLMSAGFELPKKLLVHGYLSLGGQKISKSLGNVIDPLELVEKYGSDVVRYSLLKCNVFDDSDYSEEILIKRNNTELANKFGNLVARVSGLVEKNGLEKCKNSLLKDLDLEKINSLAEGFEFDKVLNEIFAFVDRCNEYVQDKKPWETGDKKILYELTDSIRAISILLWPFVPSSSEKVSKVFGFKVGPGTFKDIKKSLVVKKFKKGDILFKKI